MKIVMNKEFLLLLSHVMIIIKTELQNQKSYYCDFNFFYCELLIVELTIVNPAFWK
jgi:hypothetical protein